MKRIVLPVLILAWLFLSACDASPAPAYSYAAPNAPALSTPTLDGASINAQVTLDFAAELDRQGHAAETQVMAAANATSNEYHNQASAIDVTAACIRRDMAAGEATRMGAENAATLAALTPTQTPVPVPTETQTPQPTRNAFATAAMQATQDIRAQDSYAMGANIKVVFATVGALAILIIAIAIALRLMAPTFAAAIKAYGEYVRAEGDKDATLKRAETNHEVSLMDAEIRALRPTNRVTPPVVPMNAHYDHGELNLLTAASHRMLDYLDHCIEIVGEDSKTFPPASSTNNNTLRQPAINALKRKELAYSARGERGGTFVLKYRTIGELRDAVYARAIAFTDEELPAPQESAPPA